MKRLSIAAFAAALVAIMLLPATAVAGQAKVDVCHSEGNGTFHLINVAEPAFLVHIGHGDGAIGAPVPNQPGYVFGADCVPTQDEEPRVFARAWSIDRDGNEILIAQVEDTNGDGVVSAGDTVRTNQYPMDFTGTDYGNFGITEHTVTSVYFVGADEPWVTQGVGVYSGDNYYFEISLYPFDPDGQGARGYVEGYYEENGSDWTWSQITDIHPTDGAGRDVIRLVPTTPSAPADNFHIVEAAPNAWDFINVEFFLP